MASCQPEATRSAQMRARPVSSGGSEVSAGGRSDSAVKSRVWVCECESVWVTIHSHTHIPTHPHTVLRQVHPRVHAPELAVAHFEVQVGAGGVAGAAGEAQELPLEDRAAAEDVDLAEVGIGGLPAIAVVHDNQVSVAAIAEAGEDDDAAVGGKDGRAHAGGNVD